MNSGLPEFFDGGLDAGAGSPDVVKEDVGSIGVDFYLIGVDLISRFGLGEAISAISANLDSVFGAKEGFLNWVVAEFCEMFSDKISVI